MDDSLRNSPTTTSAEWGSTFQMISWWKAETVAEARVMVVGAGALGNEVLKNLALLGVGNILIVDFDTIEYHNLSRSILYRESDAIGSRRKCDVASERLREINPHIRTMSIHGDIWLDVGLGIFRRMDVVIGCLDNRLARLFINQHCFQTGKTWIDGAIENLAGQMDVYKPGVSCYECQLTEQEMRMIQARMSCADVAIRNSNYGRIPTTPISASIIGAMQVQEALKVIHNNTSQLFAGQQFKYEGMNKMIMLVPGSGLKENCPSHFTMREVIEGRELTAAMTVGELLTWLKGHFDDEDVVVCLNFQVILEICTERSEKVFELVMAKPHFSEQVAKQYQEIPGEEIFIKKGVVDIDNGFPRKEVPLRQIGIPPLQILTVRSRKRYYYVELTGDEDFLDFRR